MKRKSRTRCRAIDLYSGVGGWSLGLRLAGIQVVASYDHWGEANETNFKNNHHQAQTVDIRRLDLSELPTDIDVVVGSPPCTEFSYSNRGGGGDIANGLKDIVKFLEVIDYLKPKAWAMENVPRVAMILERELRARGKLARFRHLEMAIEVVDMSMYGIPQRRQRCIAGSFDPELLSSYAKNQRPATLGSIIGALRKKEVRDPLYKLVLPKSKLTDHVPEAYLDAEEARINRAAKVLHPVYNAMPFPDDVTRPSRTVTATCTRVSRESIVITAPRMPGKVRRLTIRERACLQGFPITYQFYASSYANKAKMVGNAIPPAFAFFVAHALKGTPAEALPNLENTAAALALPAPAATSSTPPRPAKSFRPDRTFRFSIPSLHLKSGVRFELTNDHQVWAVRFHFGTPRSIHELKLGASIFRTVAAHIPEPLQRTILRELDELQLFVGTSDIGHMQRLWAHKGPGLTTPFMVLDKLDEFGNRLKTLLANHLQDAQRCLGEVLLEQYGADAYQLEGLQKLARHATTIWAGLLVGSWASMSFEVGSIDHSRSDATELRAA